MGRSKITVALLISVLILSAGYANSQELKSDILNGDATGTESSQTIDVEKFRKELEEASTSKTFQKGSLKGRVKTLKTKYILSPGDSMAVSVYGEPEFTQPDIMVRPDGYATIEPFGEIYVAGTDVDELTVELKEKFRSYLLDPKVSVKINTLQAAKVYIYGAVQKPGLYQQERMPAGDTATAGRSAMVTPNLTVASVISNAGGIKHNADLRHVRITNNAAGRDEEVDLLSMLEKGDFTQDIYLRSGDTIYVPTLASDAQISDKDFTLISSSSLAPADFPVRVIGAVTRPGVYSITPHSAGLNSAIAAAEGYTMDANRKIVEIQRVTPQGNVSRFFVDPTKNDVILRPNDIVFVADKSTALAGRGFTFMSNVITPFRGFSDSFNGWAEMFNPTRRYERY